MLIMMEDLTIDEAIKIYKSMLFFNRMGFNNSIASMYTELEERGYAFSVRENDIVELHKDDYTYKWLQVKFHLYLIKVDSIENWKQVKLLKKWNTTYCMLRKDMFWDGWKDENVFINDSTSDIQGVLENCGIEMKRVDYFLKQD
jgi:hypothetical protein